MDQKALDSLDFMRQKLEEFKNKNVAVLCSFGKDSIVLLDLMMKVKPDIQVLFLNTPFKPKETLQFRDLVVRHYKLNLKEYISEYASDPEIMENVVLKPNLPKTNPELCCQIFKVKPAMRAVEELSLDAWFSGIRATESEHRKLLSMEFRQGDFVRLHPLINWTEADTWRYTASHHLPVHPWYAEGYRSIGCEPCSSPGGDTERAGRWKDTFKCGGECGIHDTPLKE